MDEDESGERDCFLKWLEGSEGGEAVNPWCPMQRPIDLKHLGKLGEEVNELGSAISRCIIQGIDECELVTHKLNREWLEEEIADVLANIALVRAHFGLSEEAIEIRVSRKTKNLRRWHSMLDDDSSLHGTDGIESRHAETILETDDNGDVWIDSMTLAMELEVSVFTWSGLLLPEVEKFYGDRNLFRRVRGRRALWNFTMIDRWYRQRQSPKAGFKPRYIQKLEARGKIEK